MKMLRSLQRQARNLGSRLSGPAPSNGEYAGPRAKGRRLRGLFTRGEEGGALIEMALTAPALLLTFYGPDYVCHGLQEPDCSDAGHGCRRTIPGANPHDINKSMQRRVHAR